MSRSKPTVALGTPQEFAGRLESAVLGMYDVFSVYLGDRLGYYRSLREQGALTAAELAASSGTDERYAREWLEQQAVSAILICDDPADSSRDRRYRLPDGYDQVLTEALHPSSMTGTIQCAVGSVAPLAEIVDAFRTGAGVPYAQFGEDMRAGQASSTRPALTHDLVKWIAAMPDIEARLQAEPGAKVADVGVGFGWSSIELAKAFPAIHVDGFDLDAESVREATANAAAAGVSDRVTFEERDAGDHDLAGSYDFAFAIECIHDMANPVAALSALRRLVGQGGTVLVADAPAAEVFTAPGGDGERMLYGFSVFHCLPVGRTETPSAATGGVMRPKTFRGYASHAGFQRVEILPVSDDHFRLYRLTG